MTDVPDLLRRMYLKTLPGRIALFSLVLLFTIPLASLVGGAPPLSELHVVEGVVLEVQHQDGLKGSTDVKLIVSDGPGTELRYFANPGDAALAGLLQLKGQSVRAWVKSTYENRIYQLESAGRRVVDYEVRNRQLSGDPDSILVYLGFALGVFVLLTIKRYSEEAHAPRLLG